MSFDFGKKSRNPVDDIRFYRKSEPQKVIEASSRDFSKMLPKDDFQEVIIRVYCKSADKFTEAERYMINIIMQLFGLSIEPQSFWLDPQVLHKVV